MFMQKQSLLLFRPIIVMACLASENHDFVRTVWKDILLMGSGFSGGDLYIEVITISILDAFQGGR